MYERFIEDILFESLAFMPVTLLRGSRQTGKTTLVKSIVRRLKDYNYISFDDITVLAAAQADPMGFHASIG